MYSADFSDTSIESSALRHLTAEQKERLTEAVDQYLLALEKGLPPRREDMLRQHPDLADPLEAYLRSLEHLHDAAAGFASRSPRPTETETSADEQRLGDFQLIREIGCGGMGVVYEARQISLNRRVALKVLPFAAVLDSKQIVRFKNEANAAAQLDHPNIVSVFAVGSERGVHYYAMQLVDGQPLDRAIAELRAKAGCTQNPVRDSSRVATATDCEAIVDAVMAHVDPLGDMAATESHPSMLAKHSLDHQDYYRAVVRLGIQAADALQTAHEYGIVHRDIKPSNLLLDGEGKLLITDFGLARYQTDVTLTRAGDVIGTIRYMSPEQASGQADLLDRRTDIYSLGATLYELLTLQPAFPDEDGRSLLQRIKQDEPLRPRQLQPRIPRDLETVILKAMAKHRTDRYRTARELADDLQRLLDGRPTVAKPPTIPQRITKWARRHRPLVATAAVAGLFVVVGMAVSILLIAREKAKAQENFARAERNFRDATKAVDFCAETVQGLADVPGAGHARRALLQNILGYHRRFIKQNQDDPALRAHLALTYSKIGDQATAMGSIDEALDAYRNARDLYATLVTENPRITEYRACLANSHNRLGLALRRSGSTVEAERAYRDALQIQRALVHEFDDRNSYRADLAMFHSNLGLLQSETDEQQDAEASFRAAIRLQQDLLRDDPGEPEYLRQLATSFSNLSTVYRQHPTRAASWCKEALTYRKQAAEARPRDHALQSELALAYNNLGVVQTDVKQFAEAATSYGHAIRIQEELVHASPANRTYQRELAVSLNNTARVQSRLGRVAEAEEGFRRALALQELLVDQDPLDVTLRASLGGMYNNLGFFLEELRRFDEAVKNYEQAVEHQRLALTRAPTIARHRDYLDNHYCNHGRVLRALGRPEQAARVALARKDLWPSDANRLFAVAEELALAAKDLAQSPESEAAAKQVADWAVDALREAIAAGYPLTTDFYQGKTFDILKEHRPFVELVEK